MHWMKKAMQNTENHHFIVDNAGGACYHGEATPSVGSL
jgi:hypothetical protein